MKISNIEDFKLENKTAIITGASRGIGFEIASKLSAAGANVVLTSRTQSDLAQRADEIEQNGGRAIGIAAHMGEADNISNLVDQTIEKFGGIDILVNNAGTNPHFGPILQSEESHWLKTIDVNVMGYYRMAKAVFPSMHAREGGKIINISSVAGLRPQPGMGVYCVSKAGVLMLTKVLASELAEFNIQVNAIAPGFIKTKFSSVLWQTEHLHNRIKDATPQSRVAEPDEVAGMALYLASPASSFTTGGTFVVDGGLMVSTGIKFPFGE